MRSVPNPLERNTIKQTRQRIGGPWVWPGAVRLWVVYPAVLVGTVIGLWGLTVLLGTMFGAVVVLAVLVGVVVSPIVMIWVNVRVNKKRNGSTWRALLWHGRCAVCAHPLERGFDVNGITDCSECGAHWALDRLRWGACPGCGYTLGGVPRNEAGEVVCPECGQGWWMSDRAAGAGWESRQAATIGVMQSDTIPISLAHSPDSDDLVMWWPLVGVSGPGETPGGPVIDTGRFRFALAARDVEELNKLVVGERAGTAGLFDVTAISAGAYPAVAKTYAITRVGGSFGEGYGPRVVVREDSAVRGAGDLRGKRVAVPGVNTSAFLTLSLMLGEGGGGEGGGDGGFLRNFEFVEMLFSEIPGAVARGEVDAGLLIHEAQLTFGSDGLRKVADLGVWWDGEMGMPLPLGLNVVRRDLDDRYGAGTVAALGEVLAASVRHAVDVAPGESRRYLQLNKGERTEWDDPELVDKYLSMYVSGLTMDMGGRGVSALKALFARGAAAGLCGPVGEVEIV